MDSIALILIALLGAFFALLYAAYRYTTACTSANLSATGSTRRRPKSCITPFAACAIGITMGLMKCADDIRRVAVSVAKAIIGFHLHQKEEAPSRAKEPAARAHPASARIA